MNLETFFEKFNLFADTPDAVAKMRELVLEWATTGRLCNSRSGDWREARLGDVIELISGQHLLAHEHNRDGRGIPYLTGPADFGAKHPIPTRWTEQPKVIAQPGDILITVKGAGIGKTNVLADQPMAISRQLMAIRVIDADSEFVHIVVKRAAEHFQNSRTGIAIPGIGRTEVLSLKMVLPPLTEQKRIVAKVDELMTLCDRLQAQQQERETRHAALARASLARFADAPTPANLNFIFHKSYDITPAGLRKSILTLAVQGKLVPQDPNDEPAGRVLERIDSTPKRAMRTRANDEGEGEVSTQLEPLFELPDGWEWTQFRRLPIQASVGIDRGRSMQGPEKAFAYFKMNNIRNSGGIDLSDLTRIDARPGEVDAFALADGDFLFNTRNSRELIGKTCVFRPPSNDPVLYNNNILRVKFIDGFSPDFLDYWFRSPEGNAELEKLKSNTTNVCAIYQGRLAGFPCPIPPLAEQRRIVKKVDELMALVDTLETQLATARITAAKLMEAVAAELTVSERPTPNLPRTSCDESVAHTTERLNKTELTFDNS
jgi:type I restriction enzyme, S subunit